MSAKTKAASGCLLFSLSLVVTACGAEAPPAPNDPRPDGGQEHAGPPAEPIDAGELAPPDAGQQTCTSSCSSGCAAAYQQVYATEIDGGLSCVAACEAQGGSLGQCTDWCVFIDGNPAMGVGPVTTTIDAAAAAETACLVSCGCPVSGG
jgi:hypothetical protein